MQMLGNLVTFEHTHTLTNVLSGQLAFQSPQAFIILFALSLSCPPSQTICGRLNGITLPWTHLFEKLINKKKLFFFFGSLFYIYLLPIQSLFFNPYKEEILISQRYFLLTIPYESITLGFVCNQLTTQTSKARILYKIK